MVLGVLYNYSIKRKGVDTYVINRGKKFLVIVSGMKQIKKNGKSTLGNNPQGATNKQK